MCGALHADTSGMCRAGFVRPGPAQFRAISTDARSEPESVRIRHQNGRGRSTRKIVFLLLYWLFAICLFAHVMPGEEPDTATAKVEGIVAACYTFVAPLKGKPLRFERAISQAKDSGVRALPILIPDRFGYLVPALHALKSLARGSKCPEVMSEAGRAGAISSGQRLRPV
jgi:hypothetical protein